MDDTYVVVRKFEGNGISSNISLPIMTVCNSIKGYICTKTSIICAIHSETAHKFFALNSDGHGMERGNLIARIQDRLRTHPVEWQHVYSDALCSKYKRSDNPDIWIWNQQFYDAEVADLRHIAALIGA